MKKYLIYTDIKNDEGTMLNVKLKNFKIATKDSTWALKNDGKVLLFLESYNEAEFFFNHLTDFRTSNDLYLDLNKLRKEYDSKKNKMK